LIISSLVGQLPARIEVRPDVGTQGAAGLANEPRFKVGQPNVAGPSVAADYRRMAAPVVGAIDQEATHARRPHFPKGDFLLAVFYGSAAGEGGHGP
jgi:hypothetical protein